MNDTQHSQHRNYRGQLEGKPVVFVGLTRDRRAVVDAADWPHVVELYGNRWSVTNNGAGKWTPRRAVMRDDGRVQRMTLARAVMRAKDGERVDTLNGDALDCRRANLRLIPKERAGESRQFKANRRWQEKLAKKECAAHRKTT